MKKKVLAGTVFFRSITTGIGMGGAPLSADTEPPATAGRWFGVS